MATLADLIAVAIQNARLYQRAQVLAALEERNRLARELHDSVSQAIFGIALGARTARTLLDRNPSRLAEPLDYVLSLAEAALTEIRSLIFELRPESLENDGLVAALQKQAASMQTRHNIRVNTDLCDEPDLPIELKEAVYRIAREALHNTLKHAHASQINLLFRFQNDWIALEVADNGRGFDPNAAYPGHLGLQSMRERAARFNGTLNIESVPDKGTRISVSIPYTR
jgi:signal transduction histidine kinase